MKFGFHSHAGELHGVTVRLSVYLCFLGGKHGKRLLIVVFPPHSPTNVSTLYYPPLHLHLLLNWAIFIGNCFWSKG